MNAPLSQAQIALLMSDTMSVRQADLSVRPARTGLFARLSTIVSEWTQRRTVMNELRGLSDRELVDIGLNRADLGRVFDPAFAQGRADAIHRAATA